MPQSDPARFACQFDGCKRSFSRQEHLQRHVLNHADGEFTCERCRTVFKRADLLERHMARHRQKDAEGSTLMTRKRLWKDTDGRVVNRPAKEARKISTATTSTQLPDFEASSFPLSPPKSASDIAISPSSADNLAFQTDQANISGFNDCPSNDLQFTANDNFLWETPLQPVYDSSYSTGPFDDIFAPDTASSFNMPYTTMSNYNWLFDLDLNSMGGHPAEAANPPQNTQDISLHSGNGYSAAGQMTESCSTAGIVPYQESSCGAAYNGTGKEHDQSSLSTAPLPEVDSVKEDATLKKVVDEAPMMMLHQTITVPHIEEMAHERVLDLVEMSRPTTPDGSIVSIDHPLLSLGSIQAWLEFFFLRFNTVYPLIHLPTFDPNESEPVLLLSMLLLGATYAEKDSHQLAVCIHDVLRPQIFSNPGFTAKPELWVLQATLLTECLGKSRAGQKQHDMSHLFHGLLINLIRRSDCQAILPETEIGSKENLDSNWKVWAISEQKKRLAQLCFVWDVQHAVLFSQSLCMSAFELRSTLPCKQDIWEARSAAEWQDALQRQEKRPPLLLTALKHYLTDRSAKPEGLNLLGHVILLHGLMSISWDMTRRDQTSLGLVSDKIASGSWKQRMGRAYDNWKVDFDIYVAEVQKKHLQLQALGERDMDMMKSFKTYVAAYRALYHAAQLSLAVDILDLQIYAGARHILGRPVSKIDYVRSQRVVKAWASDDSSRSALAAWHAAQILDMSLNADSVSVSGDIFHHPWTLFLANLAVWTFYQASKGCSGTVMDDEMIWDVKDDMKQLLQRMIIASPQQLTTHCKTSTAGLTAVVVKQLSKIRWGVIHDGMLVLRGLVQWRLINDEECRG